MDNELVSYVFLLQAGYTHKELKQFLHGNNSQSALTLWKNTKNTILPELPNGRKEKILEKRESIDEVAIQRTLEKFSVEIIPQNDPKYPESLKTIGHSPAFLFVRGNIKAIPPLIGIVGSRKNTPYAEKILKKIIPDIIHMGVGIVSGGASGVDTLAHEICLEAGGYTVVVLGTGIDINYPLRNRGLFEKIIESGGAIISHFPLSLGPEQYNFPMRNEIVAALGKGILIPEAALSSGTLITAQLALEHGRDVFAVPGDIDRDTSEGTNMLIATGQAKCVRCSGDILEEYFDVQRIGNGMNPIIGPIKEFTNEEEENIYEKIRLGNSTIDSLLLSTQLEMTELLSHIALLEIAGHIELDIMGKYRVH